ncbi:MAG: ABC transporter permease [Bacteroidales bacterium]|nr:ABC transporter permease [Bacteroidales bacterium]
MLKLFRKDLILFLNDQKSFILTFLVPVILISLFAFAYGGVNDFIDSSESFQLLVVDQDQSELSSEFLSNLSSLNGMHIVYSDLDSATNLIIRGKYPGALIFHPGFQDSVKINAGLPVELIFDREQEFEIAMAQAIIINSLISSVRKIEMDKYIEINRAISNQIQEETGITRTKAGNISQSFLKMTSIVGEKDDLNLGLIQAVAGTSILMLLFSVAGIGTSILEEKENGTIKRLLYSPLKSRTILYSKMLFALFVAILQLTVMFLFSWIFLNLDITVNVEAMILMIISTAFAISSVGIFLASIAVSRHQASSLSTLVILVMSAVGGSMIPLFAMPDVMNKIAPFSINYWGIQGFYDIFWRSLPLREILPEIFVLTGTGIVLTVISIRLFSKSIFKIA